MPAHTQNQTLRRTQSHPLSKLFLRTIPHRPRVSPTAANLRPVPCTVAPGFCIRYRARMPASIQPNKVRVVHLRPRGRSWFHFCNEEWRCEPFPPDPGARFSMGTTSPGPRDCSSDPAQRMRPTVRSRLLSRRDLQYLVRIEQGRKEHSWPGITQVFHGPGYEHCSACEHCSTRRTMLSMAPMRIQRRVRSCDERTLHPPEEISTSSTSHLAPISLAITLLRRLSLPSLFPRRAVKGFCLISSFMSPAM